MSRSGLTLWVRGLAVALLWAAGTSLAARPARATGCHAPERPVLGLSFAWERQAEEPASPDHDSRPSPRFAGLPCPGEAAGPPSRVAPPIGPALPATGFEPESPAASRLVPEPGPVSAPDLPGGLDRPPRA